MPSTSLSSQSSPSSQVPPIRLFQFDSGAVGDLQNSVNLFRGDVNLDQTLFSMPGRRKGDGLDVKVSLLYQSNVYYDAMTWNRDAPTSVVGLGWSLPLTSIQLDDGGSPTAGAYQYTYMSGGIPNSLAREPNTPLLFDVESFGSSLPSGTVPASLQAEFVQRGIALSTGASISITAGSSTQGTLSDDDNEQLFNLTLDGTTLQVFDGGESYQLANYRFWKILYYPNYERWLVVNESGQKSTFGGGVGKTSPQGYATSAGNSVEWAVRWYVQNSEDATAAIWVGPSGQPKGQSQYARAWHVVSVAGPWGDSISYSYNEWDRDSTTGLIPDVEQLVGEGGKPYTKACYLTSITDVFGRTVTFDYGDKLWSNDTPGSAREYCDPHNQTPNTDPGAFQDQYETKFLQSITTFGVPPAEGESGATLFTLALLYQPSAPAGGPGSPVGNVTSHADTESLFGDTCKRFLTGIVTSNACGESLPGLVFDYHFTASVQGASPGALKSITYPQGGTATYSYAEQQLDICARSVSVPPPSAASLALPTPRVFFGPDYVVTTWYSGTQFKLTMQVYTWLGRWQAWQLTDDAVIYDSQSDVFQDLSTLNVFTSDDFFALSFQLSDSSTNVYIFQKDIAHPGQWTAANVDGVTAGCNQPTLTYPNTAVSTVTITGGTVFLLVAVMNNVVNQGFTYDRVTWRWYNGTTSTGSAAAWTKESFTPSNYTYVTAQNEYYLLLDTVGNVSLFYLDPTLTWNGPQTATIAAPDTSQTNPVALVPSDSFVVISNNLNTSNSEELDYTLSILQWDETYTLQSPGQPSFTLHDQQGDCPTTWIPTVVSNTLVGVSAHVLRYNGQSWMLNSELYNTDSQTDYQQCFAYGPDYAIDMAVDDLGVQSANVLSFDAGTDWQTWNRIPASASEAFPVPQTNSDTANWPSAGNADFLCLGQYLYFRGTATNWDDVVGKADGSGGTPTDDIQEEVNQALQATDRYVLNAEGVVNESPNFLAYCVFDSEDGPNQFAVTVLMNGEVALPAQLLPSEYMYYYDSSNDDQPQDPGTQPGGPGTFVGYFSSNGDFDTASQITLHRYAGYAVEGPLTHYAVASLTIDDGFNDPWPTSYAFDTTDAACDPTGLVAKYYSATVYPGTNDTSTPTFGSTVHQYLNGYTILSQPNYYNMMDGLLYQVSVYDSENSNSSSNDNKPIAQTTNTWTGYVARAGDPSNLTVPVVNLKGGFVVQTGQTKTVDNVSSSNTTSYVPESLTTLNVAYSGQPVSKTSTTMGGGGTSETFTSTTTFGYDVDDVFLALHMLTTQAQLTTTWQAASGGIVTTAVKATTYTSWPSALGSDVMVPAAEAQFSWTGGTVSPSFPHSTYQPGQVPTGWALSSRILARTPLGLMSETADGCGTVSSTLFGDQSYPVASFVNASLSQGQCAYYGFESYESGAGFTLSGATVTATDAHTGDASLELPAGGTGSLGVTVTPANQSQTYVLGYWYKTPDGFQSGGGTGWSIVVTVDSKAGTPQAVGFADTDGVWVYNTVGIALTAGSTSISITATASNKSADTILIDSVFLMPLVGTLEAETFDTDYQLVTSSMDASGHTTRNQYDRFQRQVATVGPEEQTKELTQTFLSRAGNASDGFDQSCPNAGLTLHPAGGGILESFLTGDEWTSRWDTGGNGDNWTATAGTLRHIADQNDTLTWCGSSGTAPATAALFFEVVPEGTLAGAIGITFGSGYQIQFDPTTKGYSFTDASGNSVQSPLATPPNMATQWLLVMGFSVVLFFGDGQLLFSQDLSYGATDTVAIATGPNQLQFRNLAVLAEPRLGVSHSDAAGRQRQVQHLFGQPQEGSSDARIVATIYDALNRTVAVTRTAPASFGADADLPLLAYHPHFADVTGFLQNMTTSWQLSGDVADYYAGQSDGPVIRSDDQGYSYRGYSFIDAPLKRQVERGLPGKAYAINNTTTPQQRQTTQYTYSANAAADTSLTAGDYTQQTTISPLKSQAVSIKDTAGRQVFSSLADSGGSASSQTTAVTTYADSPTASGATRTIKLPNAFTSSPQTDSSAFVSTVVRDPLGRVASQQDPSDGTTLSIYDPVGRVRFVQPELDSGETWFLYSKYDPLGRLLEEGTVAQAWNAADLQTYAAEPDWPTNDVTHTVSRTYQYDGDGSDPTAIGQVAQVVTVNPAPTGNSQAGDVTVTEAFTYDSAGRMTSVTMTLTGAVSQTGQVTYQYNNLNESTVVGYPGTAAITEVFYSFDDEGHMIAVGSAAEASSDIAAYTYSSDGKVETEVRNSGALTGVYQYYSPGWLQQLTETVGNATTPCFSLGCTYNADATMATRTITSAFDSTGQTTQVTYAYDGQCRLTGATVADSQPGNESVGSYDANGNIWSVTQDGVDYSFTSVAGSDRLQSATLDGKPVTFQYSADGWLTQGDGYSIDYDPCLGRTTNVAVSGNNATQVRLAYGAAGQRVLKQVSGASQSTTVYFCGSGTRPLASVDGSAWVAFIAGPTGLAAAANSARYFPLRDLQGSVWAVVDDQSSLVAQYDYLPFGGPLGTPAAANVIGQRFMGQPLDVETGLYDFQARLYDPVLRRFCSPDPAGQFASPYVFVGNDPLTMIDPTGDISESQGWAIGIMSALTLVNLSLTFLTFGAGVELTATEEEVELDESASLLEKAAAKTESVSNKLTRGINRTFKWTRLSGLRKVAGSVMKNSVGRWATSVVRGTLSGAERGGLQYTFAHGSDFSWGDFGEAAGIGAGTGAVASGFGSLFGSLVTSDAPTNTLGRELAGAGFSSVFIGIGLGAASAIWHLPEQPTGRSSLAGGFGGAFAGALAPWPIAGPALGALAGWGISKLGASPASAPAARPPSTMVDQITKRATQGDAAAVHTATSSFLMGSYKPRKNRN